VGLHGGGSNGAGRARRGRGLSCRARAAQPTRAGDRRRRRPGRIHQDHAVGGELEPGHVAAVWPGRSALRRAAERADQGIHDRPQLLGELLGVLDRDDQRAPGHSEPQRRRDAESLGHHSVADRDLRGGYEREPGHLCDHERPPHRGGPGRSRSESGHELGRRLDAHAWRQHLAAPRSCQRLAALGGKSHGERVGFQRAGEHPARRARREHEQGRPVGQLCPPARVRALRGSPRDQPRSDRRRQPQPRDPERPDAPGYRGFRRPVRRQRRAEPGDAPAGGTRSGLRRRVSQRLRPRPDEHRAPLHDRQRRQRWLGGRPCRGGPRRQLHERPKRARDDGRGHPAPGDAGLLRRAPEPDSRQQAEHLQRSVACIRREPGRM
jgi:hypothetical protein